MTGDTETSGGRQLPPGHYGADALTPGDRVDCGAIVVTAEMIDSFAALTGDRFEIHMSETAARAHGFDARVAHGLLVLSLIDGLKNQAAAQLKARASLGWTWAFRAPVLAGDTIHVAYTITGIKPHKRASDQTILTLDFHITNQRGEIVQTGENALLSYR